MAVLGCLPLSAFVAQCPAATCTAAVASFALTGWAFLAGGKLSTPRAADSCLQALSRALCCAVAASISTAPLTGPSRSTSPTALLCRPSTCAAWWTAPPAAPLRLFASSPPRRFAASPLRRLTALPPRRLTAPPLLRATRASRPLARKLMGSAGRCARADLVATPLGAAAMQLVSGTRFTTPAPRSRGAVPFSTALLKRRWPTDSPLGP